MPLAEAWGAICVQRFDGSHNLQFTLRIAFRCVLHRCVPLCVEQRHSAGGSNTVVCYKGRLSTYI